MKKIGITTTVPIEILMSAGYQPVDLNNIFISDPNPERLVNIAEKDGFPLNCCTWIKGIYSVCKNQNINEVLCVTTGDCSNTVMLMEVFKLKGLKVIPFAFPDKQDTVVMQKALDSLAQTMDTTVDKAEDIRKLLLPVREKVRRLDEMTWKDNIVSGYENHIWQVCASDFNGDYVKYQQDLEILLKQSSQRRPFPSDWLRLGYIGVPPVFARDFYEYLEKNQARVVFNEIQRQFAMPEPCNSLAEQYTKYTYPYSICNRLEDIQEQIKKRHIDGIIHYVQAFCHRGIGDIIFRSAINLPILTIEGNQDFYLTQHMRTRIEAFLDMVRHNISSRTILCGQ